MFCAISGVSPINPVVSKVTGHVYEKDLIEKYIRDNEGRDPITGSTLTEDDLLPIKTSPSAPTTAPRPAQFNSIPSLLAGLQNEWDSSMLEVFELRKQASSLRQELSHALYKEDAAMRVLARIMRERDEARSALASIRSSMGLSGEAASGSAPVGDVEMDTEGSAKPSPLPAAISSAVDEVAERLSSGRKATLKKPAPEGYASVDNLKALAQEDTIPSMHGTKPPGISCLDVSQDGNLTLTGGMDKNVLVYQRSTKKTLATLKGHKEKVTSAVFVGPAPEGDDLPYLIASSSADKTIRLWSTDTSAKAKASYATKSTISSHSGEVNALVVHPCNTLLASAGADGWAFHDITDPAKPTTICTVALPDSAAATSIDFHPDGKIVGVGADNGKIYVYNVQGTDLAATFEDANSIGPVTSLSFSENGYILASAAGSAASVWDLRKEKSIATLPGGEGDSAKVVSVAWDVRAQYLVAAGSSVKVWQHKVWDAPLVTLEENASDLMGAKWAKQCQELVVAGLDRTIRVFAPKAV